VTRPTDPAAADSKSADYVTRVLAHPDEIEAQTWDDLLTRSHKAGESVSPFLHHAYLSAMHNSGSAVAATGWHTQWFTLWQDQRLCAAAPLYLKDHSRGEYVFDWSWARAYQEHGLNYYPKALVAVPFTPVPDQRLLADSPHARQALLSALQAWAQRSQVSSIHVLFLSPDEAELARQAGWSLRPGVQFHWVNQGWTDFDAFLGSMQQIKRKKIRQERRKVSDAGVRFVVKRGEQITADDWALFYRCYETTYWEHGNPPYLTPDFFARIASDMSENWVMFIAHDMLNQAFATSLIGLSSDGQVAYGRYWGALQDLSCLHFEACYYQPLAWCIANGVQRFEGGAQGEHKMARALLPTPTVSAHWLSHPGFAAAVQRFTEEEAHAIDGYKAWLDERNPFKTSITPAHETAPD
jgi:uncharacterized protein